MSLSRFHRLAAIAVLAMGSAAAVQAQPPLAPSAPSMPPHGGWQHGGGHHGMGIEHEHEHERMEHLLDVADATDQQRKQIKDIMMAAHSDLQAQHEAGRKLHEQAEALFAAPTIDAQAAEALRAKGEALHDAASKRMLKARLDIANVFTPEQRARIAHMMERQHKHMEEHKKAMESHMKDMAAHRPGRPASAPQ